MQDFQATKFGDLKVVETLAQTHGGSTKIYLAQHQSQLLVCKSICKQAIVNDAIAVQHAKNEKQALLYFTKLGMKRVSQIRGTFQDNDNLYILMDVVEGLPLHKLIKMMGPFNIRLVKILCTQVAMIMRGLHSEGFIYRDIKASNFMVNKSGRVTLIDLGTAKRINKQRTYTICGTSHAMPPDIYKKQGYSYEFDYYSFGVLVYELLVGTPPFGYGGSNKNIVDDVDKGLAKDALDRLEDPQAKDLIVKLIVKDPAGRLGNKKGFTEILQHRFFQSDLLYAEDIFNQEDELDAQLEEFAEFVSQIEDLGIDFEKYQEISPDDPFFKFTAS